MSYLSQHRKQVKKKLSGRLNIPPNLVLVHWDDVEPRPQTKPNQPQSPSHMHAHKNILGLSHTVPKLNRRYRPALHDLTLRRGGGCTDYRSTRLGQHWFGFFVIHLSLSAPLGWELPTFLGGGGV